MCSYSCTKLWKLVFAFGSVTMKRGGDEKQIETRRERDRDRGQRQNDTAYNKYGARVLQAMCYYHRNNN